ncbi:MAG: hypothetical protein IID61_11880 [SAR324 cluster bacterium]|nr:hypothetical protein [SAR324 cluster bacterium]
MDRLDFSLTPGDSIGVAFRDVLFLMVLGMVVMIYLLGFLINPVSERQHEVPIHGEIVVEAIWPSGTRYDVDLWVMGPDGIPVGWGYYSAAPAVNLERDDRGAINDAAKLNYEMISVRRRLPGEYTVNLHMFHPFGEPLPVSVTVKVTGRGDMGEIYSGQSILDKHYREITVLRFSLDEEGALIEGSLNNIYKEVIPVATKYMRGETLTSEVGR